IHRETRRQIQAQWSKVVCRSRVGVGSWIPFSDAKTLLPQPVTRGFEQQPRNATPTVAWLYQETDDCPDSLGVWNRFVVQCVKQLARGSIAPADRNTVQ